MKLRISQNIHLDEANVTRHAKDNIRTYVISETLDMPADPRKIWSEIYTAHWYVRYILRKKRNVALSSDGDDAQADLGLHCLHASE